MLLRKYVDYPAQVSSYLLAADIGGTNSNFGFFYEHNGQPVLVFSLHLKSKEIGDFSHTVSAVLAYAKEQCGAVVDRACFAAAGVPSTDRMSCKPTNLAITIDIEELQKKASLRCAFLVNDFVVIGYGLSLINQRDIVSVKEGMIYEQANRAIVGAGTGLGKSILYWNDDHKRYMPVASEGGHADASIHTRDEADLVSFIIMNENRQGPLSWEDFLSGDGIRRIYQFFSKQYEKDVSDSTTQGPHPDEIFAMRDSDAASRATYDLYVKLYGRCAKNFALESLARAGMYIAGGIAAHNLPLFKENAFIKEFHSCKKQAALLAEIPIFVITDYNISLYGAAQYLLFDKYCML